MTGKNRLSGHPMGLTSHFTLLFMAFAVFVAESPNTLLAGRRKDDQRNRKDHDDKTLQSHYCGEICYRFSPAPPVTTGTLQAWFKLTISPADFNIGERSGRRMFVFFHLSKMDSDSKGKSRSKSKRLSTKKLGGTILSLKLCEYRGSLALKTVWNDEIVPKLNIPYDQLGWKVGQWYHVALSWVHSSRRVTLKVYVNGVCLKSYEMDTSFSVSKANALLLRVGKVEGSSKTMQFDSGSLGIIDVVCWTSRVLSDKELKQFGTVPAQCPPSTILMDTFNKVQIRKKSWTKSSLRNLKTRSGLPENGETKPVCGPRGTIYGPAVLVGGSEDAKKGALQLYVDP